MKLTCSKTSPLLGGLIAAEYARTIKNLSLQVLWGDENVIDNGVKTITCESNNDLLRFIARLFAEAELYGNTPLEKTEVDHWLTYSLSLKSATNDLLGLLMVLNKSLDNATFLAGKRLTIADFGVFASLYSSKYWQDALLRKEVPVNVLRWFNFVKSQATVVKTLESLPNEAKLALAPATRQSIERSNVGLRAQEGKFVDLPGAEMGKVVVRFPPEASGYLHIGHAKAALLNQYYQESFEGKLIMRFDDTNPAKENPHFEKVILEDLSMLEIKYDIFSHTSQHFDLMQDYCVKLIKESKAYVDDTEAEAMKTQREQRIESANRNNDVQRNLALWAEMVKGSGKGQKCCVRAKIDMQSLNGCLRDPTIYRCKNEPHPRTGDKYKVYPTYDFACPIVDSVEGVTHTLRTMEYHDRDPQYYWFIDALGLRKPYIWEYSRLSMTNTVLSKRKLTWFVEQGLVDGWDDPRMPTVRGILRRGMTVQGLKEFIIAQGSSRSVVFMEWDKIWAFNKKVIDPIAPRYTALDCVEPITVNVKGVQEECLTVPKHPKNNDIGSKSVWVGPKILIDRVDADSLKEGENATFINWGNLMIRKIHKDNGVITTIDAEPNLDNKDYRKTLKLTWLAVTDKIEFAPTWCVYFDHLISKPLLGKDEDFKQFINYDNRKYVQMIGDPELKTLKQGDIIQLQRRGFFRVDVAYKPLSPFSCVEQALVLFYIPDGHTKDSASTAVTKPPASTVNNSKKATTVEQTVPSKTALELNDEIVKQGEIVRNLKSQKAPKTDIDNAVKQLLALKFNYKNLTDIEWKPGCVPVAEKKAPISSALDEDLNATISAQGDKVRKLKSEKADKSAVEVEVKKLLNLKEDYKERFGKPWAPTAVPQVIQSKVRSESALLELISSQGNIVRQQKEKKAPKSDIEREVQTLLKLKEDFKKVTGKEWKPGTKPASNNTTLNEQITSMGDNVNVSSVDALVAKVTEQGNVVRDLKAKKASKDEIDEAVKVLLSLKEEYKQVTGTNFPTTGKVTAQKPKETQKSAKEKPAPKDKAAAVITEDGASKKQTRLGLEAKKEEHLSDWYSQVITKGEMIEYYDVSGCYIYRPWSFALWKTIKEWFSAEIEKLGVEDCYFPIFVSRTVLEKEKTHIADFAPEVAWVTKSGDSDLAEPIAVRPTSETVMYPAYAKWVQSYRDLPIKLNQWNNVVRWEFKHPQPFLRTREFLWQEGHTAYASQKDACDEVKTILDLYANIYTEILAIPVIKGRKTEKEKFAGGDYTLTIEAFVSASGRGIQGATSHHLGQNFSKMFDIVYEDPETQEKKYVYQNSWGLTTRSIGVMVMVHGDNKGLVLPPRAASVQVVIVPCGITAGLSDEGRDQLQASCDQLEAELKSANVKVKGDYRPNYSPGWKFNHWELKGVPIRVELGPKDIEKQQVVAVRRDTGEKITLPRTQVAQRLKTLLEEIHNNLLQKASNELKTHTILLRDWSQFAGNLDKKNIILAPFCGDGSCEDRIKTESARDDGEAAEPGAPSMGAKSLCIPLDQPAKITDSDKCIHPECKRKPQFYTLFGRSY